MMMNSEIGIVPVAVVCDRRRMNSKHPTEFWTAGVFGFPIIPSIPSIPSTSPTQFPSVKPSFPRRRLTPKPLATAEAARGRGIPGQSQSNRVNAFFNRYRPSQTPTRHTIYCGLPVMMHNQWGLRLSKTPPRTGNPQSAIAVNSTYFHLVPLNST